MHNRFLALLWTVAVILLVCACGSTAQSAPVATNSAKAQGNSDQTLATGHLIALPIGTLYINISDVPQAAGSKITHKHIAGFVYVVAGTQTLTIVGGDTLTLKAGEAGFTGAGIVHSHINPASTANEWYFLGVRPTTARTLPPFAPGVKVLYATPDLPTLPRGAYDETLRLITLQPGGRGPAHKNTGVETLFILAGSLSVHLAGQSPVTVTLKQGIYSLPNTAVQEFNAGSQITRYLAFDIGPAGQAFQTNLDQSP